MIEFGFHDSEDQDWHIFSAVALEQEIAWYTCSRILQRRDPCIQQGCLRSRMLCFVALCAPRGGGKPLLLVARTPRESLHVRSQPGLTGTLQLSLDLELNAVCVEIQKCSPSAASSAPHSCSALAVQLIPPILLRSFTCEPGC